MPIKGSTIFGGKSQAAHGNRNIHNNHQHEVKKSHMMNSIFSPNAHTAAAFIS